MNIDENDDPKIQKLRSKGKSGPASCCRKRVSWRWTPHQFTKPGRLPAIEDKTWNHPVLVCDILLVRNGQELAAFGLSLAGR
jgi:hypothetical protein